MAKSRGAAKEQYWRGVVRRLEASGLGVRRFCEQEGLAERRLHWAKRLERGSFQRPPGVADDASSGLELSAAQLTMMLEGIDLTSVRQRIRYHRQPA